MKIVKAKVYPFKSINEPIEVNIEDKITVLVGMNEAGKTVFLQSLAKSNDASKLLKFDPIEDYPRKDLSSYLKVHTTEPAIATELTYSLSKNEIDTINKVEGTKIKDDFQVRIQNGYNNRLTILFDVDEIPVIKKLSESEGISSDAKTAILKAKRLRDINPEMDQIGLSEKDKELYESVKKRIAKTDWVNIIQWEVWNIIKKYLPKYMYFSNYEILPSKMNLNELQQKVEQAKSNPAIITAEHRGILGLLRMADISISDFTSSGGYEPLKAKIEAVSIKLTDQILEFWKQNEELEVEVDIKADPEDNPPYNNGPNIYLRIKNTRHRGVSTPFRQRSHGFTWFFSFLVWFDDIRQQLLSDEETKENPIVLLLDEPGLSLHALAQNDFLKYIDQLSDKHQVIYTTHSPFMIHSERLKEIRIVEDKGKIGTRISENIEGSDARTIFPLQAALGWTIAQNLFISEKNVLVEGPSELLLMKMISGILENENKEYLQEYITIVPTGGLDKVATFIALLGANGLKLCVFHDYKGNPEQRIIEMEKQKLISSKAVLNTSQFRDLSKIGDNTIPSDIEDLFDEDLYLEYFNKTFAKQLNGIEIMNTDLPPGDRIVDRIERFIDSKKITLRPSGGYNHYLVALEISRNPPDNISDNTKKRFEAVFKIINQILV